MSSDLASPMFKKARGHQEKLDMVEEAINDLLWGQVIVKVRNGEITRIVKSEEKKVD